MSHEGCDILLVEDDVDVREAIAEGLEDVGYHVMATANGREALDYLKTAAGGLPGLILLDLMMPTMDGWEFQEQMAREPTCAGIPVVVLSAAAIGSPSCLSAWPRKRCVGTCWGLRFKSRR